MKKVMMAVALGICLAITSGSIHARTAYEALQGPTETRYWDSASAYDGYTLFAAHGTTYLIDMEGYVVHTWSIGTNPRLLTYNGNLLDATKDDPSGFQGFRELDWDGNVVWEYLESREGYAPHHDWVRIFNEKLDAYTTLYIANKFISHEEAIAAGCDPADGPYDGAQMDAIVEVDMEGNVVWEWWFFDHAVQDIDPAKSNYVGEGKTIADYPGRINLNLSGRPVKRDWLHCNSLDYNAELDQIVTNSVQGEFYVIDHGNSFIPGDPEGSIALAAGPVGDFLYRFGDPARYGQGNPPAILEDWTSSTSGHKQIGGSHDIQWIRPGLPGEGNFLVFNNGQYLFENTPQSYVFEIGGFLGSRGNDTGNYVNPPDAGYYSWELPKDTHKSKKQISNQIVWIYSSKSNQAFFSHIGSGAQRLANGNTLICADTEGHIFEVTDEGELVWEYINPVTKEHGIVEVLSDSYPMTNAVFRAYRYGGDHPALSGRQLTPGETITGKPPAYLTPDGEITGTVPDRPTGSTEGWSGVMGKLPDTGQSGDHTAVSGEDSDYSINPLSYTDHGDGTITDNVTGLLWQQVDGGEMTWEEALAYAENLSFGGYDDWRLPNVKELRSISDDRLYRPSLDVVYFPDAQAERYWSSTTLEGHAERAWSVNFDYGLVSYDEKTSRWYVRCVRGGTTASKPISGFSLVPGGRFEMGDHHDLGGAEHKSDEVPIHTVSIDSFYMGSTEVTVKQYCDFLKSALAQGSIEVRSGVVYASGGSDIYFETRASSQYSRIGWDGNSFTVLDSRDEHPVTDVRWRGAAAYCNWLSAQNEYPACYDLSTGMCDFSKKGFRLPTEAEWEYASRGGEYDPYFVFPWGDNANEDGTLANWPGSDDPYETGPMPWTTPVGFYNGELHRKADFAWPGNQESYQTEDGSNGYGLYDMSGNVWEWCNDWYDGNYYSASPSSNPSGPDAGKPMPDGKPYHVLRGGNWFNGEQYWGHSRVANRNPAYYRGPEDPDHPWYHVGFRVVWAAGGAGKNTGGKEGSGGKDRNTGVVAPGATAVELAGGFEFVEGPAADAEGNVFFTDIANNRIHRWSVGGELSTFRENSGGANGLFFDEDGNLLACEGDNGRLVSIDRQGRVTVLADEYEGKRFNKPNDLWVDSRGGVYFSDPIYGAGRMVQDGEYVYYLTPKKDRVLRVVDDLVRPNGLIGTADGKTLYVADHGAGKTYRYAIGEKGALADRTLFASRGSDGMTMDSEGNVYLTDTSVVVYDSSGRQIEEIPVPQRPTNICFGGRDGRTLYVTAQSSLYAVEMRVAGTSQQPQQGGDQPPKPDDGGENEPSSGGQSGRSLSWDIGLQINDPIAYDGYTLFAPKHYTRTYLMDNAGRVVNTWDSQFEPGQSVHLLPNGHLLHSCFIKSSTSIGGGEGGRLEEYDWDGNQVWEFDYYTDQYAMHHDIEPLPNGNIIALAVEKKTEEECVAAGFRRDALRDRVLYPDYVIEIEPTYPRGGRIVWEWHVWDHLIQENDPAKSNYGAVADHPERISVDVNGGNATAFWNHMNSIDYNPELDQIMLSVRGCSELWIIDHSTTTQEAAGSTGGTHGRGGDLLYRWGNPAAYGRGDGSDQMLFQQHDAQWIELGNPGEGNILIFNNGLRRLPPGVSDSRDLPPYEVGADWGYSSVDEIVPPVDAGGNYLIETNGAYGPDELEWTYVAETPTDLFAEAISGAQRLPNGNTLICDGTSGILFEVTSEGEIVWKYVCPVTGDGPIAQGDPVPLDERSHAMNAIFKVHRYDPDYSALAGRELVVRGPIEKGGSSTAVENEEPILPRIYALVQNYPNPFNATTIVPFVLPERGKVTLKIHNTLGQQVATLINGYLAAGSYQVEWNARGVPSGLYFYTLEAGEFHQIRKMLLLK